MVAKPTWRRWPRPDELRAMLDYNPDTGVLTWKRRSGARFAIWNARYPGKRAGTKTTRGRITMKIDDQTFAAHHVIWAMVHNRWPECITHKNGDRGDNRLVNLRLA